MSDIEIINVGKNEINKMILDAFKERLKVSNDEDENLTRILKACVEDLVVKCQAYDIHTSETFKELVFERGRYVYNDAIEYFNKNFTDQITALDLAYEHVVTP